MRGLSTKRALRPKFSSLWPFCGQKFKKYKKLVHLLRKRKNKVKLIDEQQGGVLSN